MGETLRGKPLFPHVAFRSVSLQVHFGPAPMAALPFAVRCWQDAAEADTAMGPELLPKDGKWDVVFPVGLPDEAAFDWLEGFLAKHPHFVEISDRKIVDWAACSGLWKPPTQSVWKFSKDKPEVNFGIPAFDDLSARRFVQCVAPL